MPYPSNDTLPDAVKERYSDRCQTVWRDVWNETYAKHSDEGLASRYAYTAAKQCQEARSMNAFRTVEETDDFHVIEGLGIPFGGPFPWNGDDYHTRATSDTNFYWELFEDRTPSDPKSVPARYARPVTFEHGFDATIGLQRLGGWSPVRQDKMGVWVRAQLDKRSKWYEYVRELMDRDALGFSSASMEHVARIAKNGDWIDWPVWDMAMTPIQSNPWAAITTRTSKMIKSLIRVTGVRAQMDTADINDLPDSAFAYIEPGGEKDEEGKTTPRTKRHLPIHDKAHAKNALAQLPKTDIPDAAKAEAKTKIVAAAKKFGVKVADDAGRSASMRSASDDAAFAMHIKEEIAQLMGCESGEPEQLKSLQDAMTAMGEFASAELAEIGTDDDQPAPMAPMMGAYMSAAYTSTHNGQSPARTAKALRKARRANAQAVRKALRRAGKTGSKTGAQIGTSEAMRLVRPN